MELVKFDVNQGLGSVSSSVSGGIQGQAGRVDMY
jgi:hypothetical protein